MPKRLQMLSRLIGDEEETSGYGNSNNFLDGIGIDREKILESMQRRSRNRYFYIKVRVKPYLNALL